MTEPVDWAPYADHGVEFRYMEPRGIPHSLSTDDIRGARSAAGIRTMLHPPIGDKLQPSTWIEKDIFAKRTPTRRLITNRVVNPLEPHYRLPTGVCLIPCDEQVFSKRVTDLMDTSDIPGTQPKQHYKAPVRVPIEDISINPKAHPARVPIMRRNRIGGALDLFDIDIGRARYGFNRSCRSNPLEPVYPGQKEETPDQKHRRLKINVIPPRKRRWCSGDSVLEKLYDKMYWKAEQLPAACNHYARDKDKDTISYQTLRDSLERFGVTFSDKEFGRLLVYADKNGTGSIKLHPFTKFLARPDGLEVISPQMTGSDIWAGVPGNMGQGLQVLVHSPHNRGKKWLKNDIGTYDVVTGAPVEGSVLRKLEYPDSYGEKLAELDNKRHEIFVGYFLPGVAKGSQKVTPTVENSQIMASAVTLAEQNQPMPPLDTSDKVSSVDQKLSTLGKSSFVASTEGKSPEQLEAELTALSMRRPTKQLPDLKLPGLNRRSMPPSPLAMQEVFFRKTQMKRLHAPTFKRRVQEQHRVADIEAVRYLD